jgi:hypothetical protein
MINRYLLFAYKNVKKSCFDGVPEWIPAFAGMTMFAGMIYVG